MDDRSQQHLNHLGTLEMAMRKAWPWTREPIATKEEIREMREPSLLKGN
jgi:hypothetical protein